MIRKWIELFDERESPAPIVLIRLFVAACLFYDLVMVGILGIPVWLWASIDAGGVAPIESPPLLYRWFSSSAGTATAMYVILLASITTFGIGLFTRASAFVFVVFYAQAALVNDYSDRGIDRAVRIVMLILAFSGAGRAWSVDAWRATGSFRGDGQPVPAWPRYLILGQLVLMYCAAGFSKGGTRWLPWGGYTALYVILQDPIFAVTDFSWMRHPVPFFLTRVGTAVTHTWEIGAPIVLLAAYYRRTADRGGWARRVMNRLPVRTIYVAVGVGFHLLLIVTLRLGIFPLAMLAFFPAFFRPEEIEAAMQKARMLLSRAKPAAATALLLTSCALFAKNAPEPKKVEEGPPPAPAWTAKSRFYEKDGATYRLYGVGRVDVPAVEKGNCPKPAFLANQALGRARAQISGIVEGIERVGPSVELAAADLLGSEPARGFYDGTKSVIVLAKLETSTAPKGLDEIEMHTPDGGTDAGEVVQLVTSAMLARLDAAGICKDPYKRHTNPCCGPPQKFCSDPTRYSRNLGKDTCACGQQQPCLYDFKCEEGEKGHRCVCRGPKCPCTILTCKLGQTCADDRCF